MTRGKMLASALLIAMLCPILTSCFDAREVDDMGFVIALGLDKGKTNALRLTLQIAKPISGDSGSGGGKDEELPYVQFSVEAPSIFSGLNTINTFASKQISLSHIKVVVFSSELAREGLGPHLNAIIRGREFRPNMPIVVARNTAEEYLKSVDPKLVLTASKYYELVYQSYRYTALIPKVEFHDFYLATESLCKNPVAILGDAVKFQSAEDFDINDSTYDEHGRSAPFEGDFFAGDTPALGGSRSENIGLAVFDGDRMVGELDGTDTTFHLLCTGDYIHSYWTVPDPLSEGDYVVIDIKQKRRPRHHVEIIDGKPVIHLILDLEGDLLSVESDINYESGQNTQILESSVESYIKEQTLRYLDKTAREFQSDICGFGNHAKGLFTTWAEWEAFQWKSKYKYATFLVHVNFNVRRPGLVMRNVPVISTEGGKDER